MRERNSCNVKEIIYSVLYLKMFVSPRFRGKERSKAAVMANYLWEGEPGSGWGQCGRQTYASLSSFMGLFKF